MPWRVPPQDRIAGILPNPYHVWLSEVMLQQTTVAAVHAYFTKFVHTWPTVENLAKAKDADVMAAWAGLGYYARARNLLKCARVVTATFDGVFPKSHKVLLSLPGIGPYTASAIAAIAFDQPETVLDGNVERVMARFHDDPTPLPKAKPTFHAYAETLTPKKRPGDYAQAVMDLGATICTPRNPVCGLCPWRAACAGFKAGTFAELPRKAPKKVKPTRRGTAYVVRREDGAFLLETRPEKGLLGGMLGWPGSQWSDTLSLDPPCDARWHSLTQQVRHTFTHFHLILNVKIANVPLHTTSNRGHFLAEPEFSPSALPTVMRKVFDLAYEHVNDAGS